MPETRASFTHKFSIAGHEGYFTVGLFEDGQPGELFITMAKEGSTIGGLMDTIATLVSLSLQYGVPLQDLVRKFAHQRFEPSGYTANPQIRMAKSIVNYIFRWLGITFIPSYESGDLEAIPVNRLKHAYPRAATPATEPALVAGAVDAGNNGHVTEARNQRSPSTERRDGSLPIRRTALPQLRHNYGTQRGVLPMPGLR